MKTLVKYFFQGLLYLVPIGVTAYVLYEVFVVLDGWLPFEYPGLGILTLLVTVTVIGFIGSFVIALPVTTFLENLLKRAPLVKVIYTSMKDLVQAFVGSKRAFNKPVSIRLYENSAIERLGFITEEDLSRIQMNEELVAVYVPHSYAFSGQLFLVPKKNIKPIDAKPADVMKFIVSGGVTEVESNSEE